MPGTGYQFPRFPTHNLVTIQTETKPFLFFIAKMIKHTHNIIIFSTKAKILFYSNDMVMHFSLHSGHNSIYQRGTRFSYIYDVISKTLNVKNNTFLFQNNYRWIFFISRSNLKFLDLNNFFPKIIYQLCQLLVQATDLHSSAL